MRLPNWISRIADYVSGPGLALGSIFFALSLTPSLIPRTPLIQGVLSGCIFAVGYALGAALQWLWRYMELPRPTGRINRWLQIATAIVCGLMVVYFLARAPEWQNAVRAAMGAEPVDSGHPLQVVLVASVPAAILIVLGTLLSNGVQAVSARLAHVVPPRVAFVSGLLIVGFLAAMLFNGVLLRAGLRAADAFFEGLDNVASQFGDPPPGDPLQSGSAASLIEWSTLGRDGRTYVIERPILQDIEAVTGRPAEQPLRVYVGLRSAPTPEARAQLALAELERVGAFERAVLIVIMPVGTGWVDPPSIIAPEYLLGGDVASVALQYSYLTSPLSLVIEPDYGSGAAQALFDAVYGYWTTLPRDARPRLYLNGLSLGAHASQSSTQFFDVFSDPFNGALWVGPPFTSPVWRWATATRVEGSPAWLPRFGDGSSIRFTNQGRGLATPETAWGPMRIAFLQYASDPIVFFETDAWYREPAWMKDQRGPDVPDALTWYPIVTFLQLAMDMALSNASPVGHGHVYSADDYVDSWASVLGPIDWDDAQLTALKAVLSQKTARQ